MNKKAKIISAALAAVAVGVLGAMALQAEETASFAANQATTNTLTSAAQQQVGQKDAGEWITVPESELPVIASEGSFLRYANFEELYQNADIVAEVQIVEQDTVNIDFGTVATRSHASLRQVFKGDSVPEILTITEAGGVLDLTTLPKMDKPGAGMEPKNAPKIVENALEGSPVMKPKNSYFVFLTKNSLDKWGYNIVGSVQGKLKIDAKTQKIVNTVDPAHLVDDDIFFLQKQLNGKDKAEVEQKLRRAK